MPEAKSKPVEPTVRLGTVGEFEMLGLKLPEHLLGVKSLNPDSALIIPASAATTLVLNILKLWKIPLNEQAKLLGVKRNSLKIRTPRPSTTTPVDLQRLEDLLAIYKALDVLFPDLLQAEHSWVTTPNKAFNNRTPVEVMLTEGTTKVRRYLEGALFS